MTEYKDALTLYEELVATGVSEDSARIQAHQIGNVTNLLVDMKKDMSWMRIIGAAMTVAFFMWFFHVVKIN
jgi:hypothetical protein